MLSLTLTDYVPLAFAPGEALQFDWSEDWFRIDNKSTISHEEKKPQKKAPT